MNLIFIMMDGARVDRILQGKSYEKLIKKSSFFPKVITYAPYTIAALHAVFSGTYGTKNGVNSYWSSPKFKKNLYKTLSSYLQDAGYYTYGDVINKLVLPKIGFDELVIHDEFNDNLLERHKKLLDNMSKIKNEGKNFFLYLHYSNIHTGIMQQVLKKYDNFSKEYFSNRKRNEKNYDELFSNADEYLGNIINHCEELKLSEDSLIVVISDHGVSLGEKNGERAYGVYCYDYTLISTALFCHPNLPTRFVDTQVRSIDILPTILEIMKISKDTNFKQIDGESLIPLMNGENEERIAFSQSGNPLNNNEPPKEPNVWAIRTKKWKYIKNIHDNSLELYDLENDPKEENNVIEKFPDIKLDLEEKMNKITESKSNEDTI